MFDKGTGYFWSSLTVAVVYALPVVQLLITYQRMVVQTGDQDVCYYNFLCAHPLGVLSDFNHVLSNAPYVILGLAFMMQVSRTGPDQKRTIMQQPIKENAVFKPSDEGSPFRSRCVEAYSSVSLA
ncbi:hypothetical protein evm_012400 [Chilo suppressalis]|nr:hypothetical protein evm_012400 [Chilo suppressalis]